MPAFTLPNPNPAALYLFGNDVAISGTRVVVRASLLDIGATDATIFVYDLSSGTPTVPVAALRNSTPSVKNSFGSSMDISGTTIAVGAPGNSSLEALNGAAYTFGPSPYSLWKTTQAGDQFAADLGDADRDGLSNLGEYGLLRAPLIPGDGATSASPALYPDGIRLMMFLARDPARDDVTLELQATGDLRSAWTTIATSVLGAPFTGPGYFGGDSATPGVKWVELRDTVNITDSPQRYLRVRVRH